MRDVVAHYNKHDDVILAWKENQRKLDEDQELNEKLMREKPQHANFNLSKVLSGWLANN